MIILIAEDDHNKVKQLEGLLHVVAKDAEIFTAQSYQSTLKQTVRKSPQLILLDMSMPTFDVSSTERGGRTRPFAGREILEEIRRKHLSPRVVVVTQFDRFGEGPDAMTLDELKEQLGQEFPLNYIGTVHYDPAHSKWRQELVDVIGRAGVKVKDGQ